MKTALVFAGQGAQKVGMGLEFYQLDSSILDKDPMLKEIILEGPIEKLSQTDITQKAIASVSMMITKEVLKKVTPACVYGLSLGEYSACWAAGVFNEEDYLDIVTQRGLLMHKTLADANSSMMAIIHHDSKLIKELCEQTQCWLSNINAPNQFIVSGFIQNLEQFKYLCKEKGIRSIDLNVSGAFHSPLLKPAAKALNELLNSKTLKPQQIPILSNVTGQKMEDNQIIDLLTQQLYSTVDFVSCTQTAQSLGIQQFIEIGPGTTNARLIKQKIPDAHVISINTIKDLEKIV